VIGGGPIGLLLIQLLRAAGAARVIAVEPLEQRREAAARCGADPVLEPGATVSGLDVDVAFEVAGSDDGCGSRSSPCGPAAGSSWWVSPTTTGPRSARRWPGARA